MNMKFNIGVTLSSRLQNHHAEICHYRSAEQVLPTYCPSKWTVFRDTLFRILLILQNGPTCSEDIKIIRIARDLLTVRLRFFILVHDCNK